MSTTTTEYEFKLSLWKRVQIWWFKLFGLEYPFPYAGCQIKIQNPLTGELQTRTIVAYDQKTKTTKVLPSWETGPTDTYTVSNT